MSLFSVQDASEFKISAKDGEIGGIEDFYFDDQYWVIRYLVADTGSWLRPGRVVLVSPHSIQRTDVANKNLTLNLTKKQLKASPEIEAAKPLSRVIEEELSIHFGWPAYWIPGTAAFVTIPGRPGPAARGAGSRGKEMPTPPEPEDPNLRSFDEVKGYHIQAEDGEVGHMEDFIADDVSWAVRYMVVDTRNWLPGRKVLVAPAWIKDISWSDRRVVVDLSKETIEASPEYKHGEPIERSYEERLHKHYGHRMHS